MSDQEESSVQERANSMAIHYLPDNCLELIFTHVNLYADFNSLKLVSRRFNKLSMSTLRRMKRYFYKCIDFSWKYIEADHLLSERCSHAVCYHPGESVIYMFGGCNNSYTPFNDLWTFDMNTYEWERVLITRHPMPTPKALTVMVHYKGNMLLFGGFSKSSMNPIHQTTTFYNEMYLYNPKTNCWEEVISENTAPHLAGHSASIVGDFMLVFGGSMGSSYNNNVYVLDLVRRIWNMPSIPGPCPPPRYGQSQLLLDDRHLVIVGGCGGPSVNFSDVWLLEFDLSGDSEWRWIQLKVENPDLTPPYMWCHPASKVGNNAVVVSRPVRYDALRQSNNRKRLHRRRTSSQSSASSAGGSGGRRLTSPDSPSDRRAVAAAFCASSAEQLYQQVQRKKSGSLQQRDKKPILLTSRSLDDQEQQQRVNAQNSGITASSSYADLQNNASSSAMTKTASPAYLNAPPASQKAGELHRACSIPAIIVGEIPKLIVTSSIETSSNNKTTQNCRRPRPNFTLSMNSTAPGTSTEECAKAEDCSKAASQQTGDKSRPPNGKGRAKTSGDDDPVREYYISLIKEEYTRLRIVELKEKLGDMEQKLDKYLCDCVPYLTKQERLDIIEEFVWSEENQQEELGQKELEKGSIHELRNRLSGKSSSTDQTQTDDAAAQLSQNRASNPPLLSSSFGPLYGRQMCVFVLRLDKALTEQKVRWDQLPIEDDAPEDRLLHSLVATKGQLVLFGGMYSDGMGMDCLNVGMERYTMSSDTYILKPRYNEM